MPESNLLNQYSIELLITGSIMFIGWMRLTSATQETSFEYEQRLRRAFGSGNKSKSFSNREESGYNVSVENVVFRERGTFWYMLKRTLWPWQDIEGEAQFSVWTEGMVIGDINEFRESMPDWGRIVECTSGHHDNHYIVTLGTIQDEVPWDTRYGYDTFFHYFANNVHMVESEDEPVPQTDGRGEIGPDRQLQQKTEEIQQILNDATDESEHPVLVVIPGSEKGINGTQLIGATPDDWRARDTLGALDAAKASPMVHIHEVSTQTENERGD